MSKPSVKALVLGMGEDDEKKPAPEEKEESGEYEVGSDEEYGQALLDAIAAKDAAAVGKAMRACAMAADGGEED